MSFSKIFQSYHDESSHNLCFFFVLLVLLGLCSVLLKDTAPKKKKLSGEAQTQDPQKVTNHALHHMATQDNFWHRLEVLSETWMDGQG